MSDLSSQMGFISSKPRDVYCSQVDEKFINQSEIVFTSNPSDIPTLYIIVTGHSIPVGKFLSEKGVSTIWTQNINEFKHDANKKRVLAQLESFSITMTSMSPEGSQAFLLDCHEAYDVSNLPNFEDLRDRSINRIILMEETQPGEKEIREGASSVIHNYLKEMRDTYGVECKVFGIDYRQSPQVHTEELAFFASFTYTPKEVEKFSDTFYCQSKLGERWVLRDLKYYKIFNDGSEDAMSSEERIEFQRSIQEKFPDFSSHLFDLGVS